MGFVKFMVFVLSCGLLVGCASMKTYHTTEPKTSLYDEGYRKGVAENLNSIVEKLNGNDFPYIGGTWAEPIVQEVRIPAHVQGGVFYPEHNELVVITPGEWKRNNPFPIKADQKDFRKAEDAVDTVTAPVTDITAMPSQFGPKGPATVTKGGE
jgi:hypothetical protein